MIDAKSTKQLTNPRLLGRVKRLEDGNDDVGCYSVVLSEGKIIGQLRTIKIC